jgi:hypothetical protein
MTSQAAAENSWCSERFGRNIGQEMELNWAIKFGNLEPGTLMPLAA